MDQNLIANLAAAGELRSLILGMVFVTTVLMVAAAGFFLFGALSPVKRRLQEIADPEGRSTHQARREGAFTVRWIEPVAKVILPDEDWRLSRLKTRLVQAGFRNHNGMAWFLAAKLVFAFVIPLLVLLPLYLSGMLETSRAGTALMLSMGGLVGFLGPDIYLWSRHNERVLDITESFPDALDMLVVCVEAGLSLDAAIQRVSVEIAHAHPEIATEMQMVSLELRAGKSRDEALRGLADRTGVEEIRSLASILIQAEHFGTSIATSLREHADDMRLLRIQKVREKAARLPVKLIFPIMFFIFPALFLVVLGPAAIRIFIGLFGTLS
jgi:tight adherence protein C